MLVQPRHVDVRAIGLRDAAIPFGSQTRHLSGRRIAIDPRERCPAIGKSGAEIRDCAFVLFAAHIQCAAPRQKTVAAQVIARGKGERRDVRPAIAFLPERGGAARGVKSGAVLRFQQGDGVDPVGGQFGGQAGTCHPGSDNGHIVDGAHDRLTARVVRSGRGRRRFPPARGRAPGRPRAGSRDAPRRRRQPAGHPAAVPPRS